MAVASSAPSPPTFPPHGCSAPSAGFSRGNTPRKCGGPARSRTSCKGGAMDRNGKLRVRAVPMRTLDQATIDHPRYWGQTALHRCVIATLVRWKLRHPFTPLYWYLICSGYRTYLTLVRNFPEHWPHHQRVTERWERGLLHALSRSRYGDAYDAVRGVISFGERQPMLKTVVATLTNSALALPEVRFLTPVNPRHARGDELAMIARVNLRAVGGMALKWLRRALTRRSRGAPAPVAGFPRPTT